MIDINFIRNNPKQFDDFMKIRNCEIKACDINELDTNNRRLKKEIEDLRHTKKLLSQEIASLKRENKNADNHMQESNEIENNIQDTLIKQNQVNQKLFDILSHTPNILDKSVPIGQDESQNIEISHFKKPKNFDFTPRSHYDIGIELDMLDFTDTVKICGSRFVSLRNDLSRLERALINFMLDNNTNEFDYTEISHPSIVSSEAMYNVGQLPKFDTESFAIAGENKRLIPTSEVFLTNIAQNKIFSSEQLPLRMTAFGRCFRSEAGAAGKDTKGMFRVHEFSKIELVSIVEKDKSEDELERMLSCAESILKKLDLPYKVMSLCSGDIGFASSKTYDIEVWLPFQNKYREISSCSNCIDFQSRRMGAKHYINNNKKEKFFVHTLNGSSLAIGRTMIAIIENYQNSDGSITVPNSLIKYMNGQTIIRKS